MLNKEDLKEKIIDRIKFGDSVMRDINGEDLKNYDIRILPFTHTVTAKSRYFNSGMNLKGRSSSYGSQPMERTV